MTRSDKNVRANALAHRIFGVTAWLTVSALVGIFLFLTVTGIGTFQHVRVTDFFFGLDWNPTAYARPSWGIGALLLGTLMVSAVALAVAVPLGLGIAIFLAELAHPRLREIIKPAIEMIASVPSVIIGLVGLLTIAPLIAHVFHLNNGLNIMTAGILVGIAALPTVASISEDALRAVSHRLRESSYALGARQWTTITRVVMPAAAPGLIAATMLGLGRVIGETMIVLMVAGNSRAVPDSLLDPGRPITANIAIEIKEAVVGGIHWQSLFALGLILFVLTFGINFAADCLARRMVRQ